MHTTCFWQALRLYGHRAKRARGLTAVATVSDQKSDHTRQRNAREGRDSSFGRSGRQQQLEQRGGIPKASLKWSQGTVSPTDYQAHSLR
jgi:hypothetical protein